MEASENTSTSLTAFARPAWAAAFPFRSGSSISAAPGSGVARMMAGVLSVEPSEMNRICRRPPGYRRLAVFVSLSTMRDCSLCTGMIIVTLGSSGSSAVDAWRRRPPVPRIHNTRGYPK